ncbi:Granaticin polyketide synthase putative ketoacyl reductase 2 [Penicillium subrubescens]|uniref:Granaticin polyketide synthase putative ketoacyl reductase 2 n=1 Tax=Penicillium subrubescens TaxID=1316194 RepID=A0A1Q5UJT1_9EURO|nr:Granaticin polyketide synthase putative ketoacyl reductase 2 [Penicillium subrubescens]
MPYNLRGRNILIVGGARGLGAVVAEKFAAEGCDLAINYLFSQEQADNLATDLAKKHGINAVTIQADAGVKEDCIRLVQATIEKLKGLDIIISNAGWTKFTSFGDLDALTDEEWDKGITAGGSSMAYSVTKSAGLHLLQCLKASQGPKVRINAVLPGLLLTEWGVRYSPEQIEAWKNKSALKHEVSPYGY